MPFLRTPKGLQRALNLYPPFLGAGIKVKHVADDFRRIDVEMKLRWYNRNYVGTHFGGSLCAMTDPFFMLMLINILGKDYVVWDQSSTIDFIAPGRGTVKASFSLSEQQISDIKMKTTNGEKYLPVFETDITNEHGEIVAKVRKKLYIRKKRRG